MFPEKTVVNDNVTIPDADAWGLRIVDSSDILIYGAGHYSFFNDYSTTCSDEGNGEVCQNTIFEVIGSDSVNLYNLNTVGTHYMIDMDGKEKAYYAKNFNGFIDTVALFRTS